jgi:hypothetical protein
VREARERALAEFERPGPLPAGARPDEAEAQLLAALERELGVRIAEVPPVPERRPASHPAGGGSRGFLTRLFAAPAWRPALALGGVLIVAAVAWTLFAPERAVRPGDEPRMRGTSAPTGDWFANPQAHAGDGATRLTWNPAPGATRYAVVFLAPDLTEIARVDDLTANELALGSERLPGGLTPASDVLWRVHAYAGADEIGRSGASPVRLP